MPATTTAHRPRVVRAGFGWEARCTCGPIRPVPPRPAPWLRSDAERDVAAHLEAVAAPESERCQMPDPHTHGVAWWEFCHLCATEPLF